MTLLCVLCSSSSIRDDSRVFSVLAISGLTRRVRLGRVEIDGHFSRLDLNLIADRGDRFDHAGPVQYGHGWHTHAGINLNRGLS